MLQSWGRSSVRHDESLKVVLCPFVTSPRLNFQPLLKLWPRRPLWAGTGSRIDGVPPDPPPPPPAAPFPPAAPPPPEPDRPPPAPPAPVAPACPDTPAPPPPVPPLPRDPDDPRWHDDAQGLVRAMPAISSHAGCRAAFIS